MATMSNHITRIHSVRNAPAASSWKSSWKSGKVSPFYSNGLNKKTAVATEEKVDTHQLKCTLEKSYEVLSDRFRAISMAVETESKKTPSSSLLKSCRVSLTDEVPLLLDEFRLLLQDTDSTLTLWRVSCIRVSTALLLDTIQATLGHPQRSLLEEKLQSMVEAISSQVRCGDDDHIMTRDIGFTVSPRKMPCLAFDVAVGVPIRYTLADEESKTDDAPYPLKLKIQPLVEILSQDLVENVETPTKARRACRVKIEKCQHTSVLSAEGGTVGLGFLQILVSSLARNDAKVHVKEARCLQRNAFPPRPKVSVDLFSSARQGSSEVTLTFKFQTFATLNNEAPNMCIDLIMGSK